MRSGTSTRPTWPLRGAAVAACLAFGLGASLSAQNWPSFRGSNASGVAEGHPAATHWNVKTSENVAWKTPIPGLAVSSPVVWGSRVFVTTAISSDPKATLRHGLYGDVEPSADVTTHQWKVFALDKHTGAVVWERTAHEGAPKTKRHPKSSQASATPATNGELVVVSFGSEGLFAYDMNGTLKWKQDLGNLNAGWFYDPDYEWGAASSPIIYKHLVIVQCDIQQGSFVAAFNLSDGKRVWMTPRDEIPSWGTPTVYEGESGAELVTHATKFIRGYDPMTGKELWRLSGNSEITVPTPILGPNLILVTNGYRGIQPIYAIRPGARGDITLQGGATTNASIAWSAPRGGPYLPTPVIYKDLLYIVTNNGVLAAHDVRTGERLYQERLAGKGGAFSASPVAADGKIYFASEDGEVHVVKAGPKYELLTTNVMDEVVMATPAISDGLILIRGLKHLYALGSTPRKTAP